MKVANSKVMLFIEFVLFFFGIPLFIFFDKNIIHPSVIILPVLILLFLFLRKHDDFKFKELIYFKISRGELKKYFLIVFGLFVFLTISVIIFLPEKLFNLPSRNILVWVILCLFYPVFSAYGQEIIYRTFLFKRYKIIFNTDFKLILASALAFSFVHIIYFSVVSIIITFIGGIYFAHTYNKSKSVLLSSILHGILGDIIFTIGLGSYFWLDIEKFL